MRYALDISYRGTAYAGWQVQANANTVQAELDKALSTILRIEIKTMGAGRTDTGVHARQLIVHFDHDGDLPEPLHSSLNGLLPPDIAINRIFRCAREDFHARFDALSRAYEYRIVDHKSPFERDYALWIRRDLDWAAIEEATGLLLEYQEFGAFCKAHAASKTNLCDIMEVRWTETDFGRRFYIKANRFLRGMVRAIVGSLIEVGEGKRDLDGFQKLIESGDRKLAGPAVDAKGLYLIEVNYAEGELLGMA